jgi:predicted porin
MKKSLIALAVLAASGVASAQSSVTLYGLVDVYVGSVKTTTAATPGTPGSSIRQSVVNGGGLNTSRFGLKGSEDLGGGLKANFLLEAGFDASTGAANNYVSPYNINPVTGNGVESGAIFGRQSWVGLSGGFGEVKLGKMWTPFDEVKGSGAAAFDANIFAPATFVWLSNTYQDRPGNAIYYSTPSFGGLTAAGMYSFGENKTATNSAGKIAAVNVAYAGGPLAAAVSYQTEKQAGGVEAVKFLQVNASYDFGVVKVLGAYGRVKDFDPSIEKTNEYQLGLDFPITSTFTLSGGYAYSKDDIVGGSTGQKRKGLGIAGLYALSKRTNLYAGVNDSKSEFAGSTDTKNRVFAAGVRHTF